MSLCGIDCPTEDLTADADGRVFHANGTRHRPVRYAADQLMAAQFPEPRWAVPGVIPEGLTMLVGGPKVGKSWLGLGLSVSIASGRPALSQQPVEAGDVLYLALEDPPRRLQSRLATVLEGHPAPARLTLDTASGRGTAAIEHVRAWLAEHDQARLVVIDVLAKVRPVNDGDDRYAADYRAGSAFKALADEYGVAVLIVHHTRKARGDDFVDDISGTNGLAGAADTLCVLQRARTDADAILKVTGRDVDETEYPLKLTDGRWSLLEGPVVNYTVTETSRKILDLLRQGGSTTPKKIADRLNLDHENVKKTCRRLADQGNLSTNGRGTYRTPGSPTSPASPDPDSPGKTAGTTDQDPCPSVPAPDTGRDTGDNPGKGLSLNFPQGSTHSGTPGTPGTGRTRRQHAQDPPACQACGRPLSDEYDPEHPVHGNPQCLRIYRGTGEAAP